LAFAVDDHGSLHGIARASDTDAQNRLPNIFYVQFEEDGSVRSKVAFEHDLIPSILLPLPNGDFFAAGTTVAEEGANDGVNPLAGIFGPDAKLKKPFGNHRGSPGPHPKVSQLKAAKLGNDQNIYLLLVGEQTKVRIIKQGGEFDRELTLKVPLQGDATGMWVSGGRIMLVFEQDANSPNRMIAYALYDARTGEMIRVYHPAFFGSLACFQDGQSLTVLVPQDSTGTLGISEAQLQ
jgi:hypothetical protein